MKKRIRSVKRATTTKSTRKTSRRSTEHLLLLPFSFRRIVLVTTAIALFLGVFVLLNKQQVTQSVAGVSVARGLFAEARIDLPKIEGTVSYNIYYKEKSASDFTNVARDIPGSSLTYTISYLKKGEEYRYKVAAVNTSGAEFYWSNEEDLRNIEPM